MTTACANTPGPWCQCQQARNAIIHRVILFTDLLAVLHPEVPGKGDGQCSSTYIQHGGAHLRPIAVLVGGYEPQGH